MNNIKQNLKVSVKAVVGVTTALMIATALMVSAPAAHADYTANIINGPDMSVGSTGQNVVVLQSLLSELGYVNIPVSVPFGYYGAITQAGVQRYQASLNVSPVSGYFGQDTKNSMYSNFAAHGYLSLLGW